MSTFEDLFDEGRPLSIVNPTQAQAPRAGNVRRAVWRQKCRVTLSNYLKEKGIHIEPWDVRLLGCEEDGYRWEPQPEVQDLFLKQISKHSVGAYVRLCKQVGKLFEAVKVSPRTERDDDSQPDPEMSFTSKIQALTDERAELEAELEQWRIQAQAASAAQHTAEKHLQQACIDLQKTRSEADELRSQNDKISVGMKQQRRRIIQLERAHRKATIALQI